MPHLTPFFQRRQHALIPHRSFHPRPVGLCALCSHFATTGALLSLCPVVSLTLPPFYPPFPQSGFTFRPSRGSPRFGTTGTLTPTPLTYGAGLPAYCATPSRRSISNHVGCLDIASHHASVPSDFRTSP